MGSEVPRVGRRLAVHDILKVLSLLVVKVQVCRECDWESNSEPSEWRVHWLTQRLPVPLHYQPCQLRIQMDKFMEVTY